MAEPKSDKRSENASKEFDIPSSPHEDYSNMMKNFNTDSDFMQNLSPTPDLVQNFDFNVNYGVNEHLVDSQQSTGKDVSCTIDEKISVAGLDDPLDCQNCDVMREVMHTNGIFLAVLSIHGQLGVFYHATLDVYHYTEGFPQAADLSYIDLKNKDLDWIKRFLLEYGALRRRENYTVINDCRSPFYDVICAGANLNVEPKDASGYCEVKNEDASSLLFDSEFAGSSSNVDAKTESINQSSPNSYSVTNNQLEHPLGNVQEQQCTTTASDKTSTRSHEKAKFHIAAQRKRTAKMQPRDIAKYFHLPLMEAAKELQICTSSLKAICRKHGITRWPQRKIRAIDNRIASLKKDLKSQTSGSQNANRIAREINWLEERREAVCSGAQSPLIKKQHQDDVEGYVDVI